MKKNLKAVSIVFLLICLYFGNATCAQPLEEYNIDMEFLQKLTVMPYSRAIEELEKLSAKEKYDYSLFLAYGQSLLSRNAKSAMQFCKYALETAEEHDFPRGQIYLLRAHIQRERAETIADLENALRCFRKEENTDLLKHCLSWLGNEYYNYGEFEKSEKRYEELLTMCTDPNDAVTRAHVLFDVGEVYYKLSKLDKANDAAEQAKTIFAEKEDPKGLADCLKLLGNVWLAKNDPVKAKEYYLEANQGYVNTNDSHGQGNCNFNLGLLSIELEALSEATEYLKKAIYFYTDAGSVMGSGIAQMELGRVYTLQGSYDQAEPALKQAESFLSGQSQYRLAQTKEYLGDLEKARGNREQSFGYYKTSAELFNTLNLRKHEARVARKIAEATIE